MERVPFALLSMALGAALAFPVSRAIGDASAAREPAVCRQMTATRMLESPALADEWAEALRSASPDAIARVRSLLAEIRAAHGCSGELSTDASPPDAKPLPPGHPPVTGHGDLPPGHPPIRGQGDLPPGHPPIPSSPRMPLFEPPAVLTI